MAPKYVIKSNVSKQTPEQSVKEIRQSNRRSNNLNKAGCSSGIVSSLFKRDKNAKKKAEEDKEPNNEISELNNKLIASEVKIQTKDNLIDTIET